MTNVSFRISWKISLLFKKMLNHLDFFIFVPLPCCSWADWCALVRKRQSCRSGTVNILYQRPPPLKFIAQGRDALCWRQPTHEIWMLPAYEPHPQSGKVLWFWLPKMALWGQFYGVGGYPLTEKVCSVLVALLIEWIKIFRKQSNQVTRHCCCIDVYWPLKLVSRLVIISFYEFGNPSKKLRPLDVQLYLVNPAAV